MALSQPSARFRAGVTGHPISHSKSPALHRAAYRELGFDCGYDAFDVPPGHLGGLMAEIRSDPTWCGLSVTMPHKAAAIPYVDGMLGSAADIGVINTVTAGWNAEGERRLAGHNTDVAGIVNAVRHAGATLISRGVILGGGGTAAAAMAAMQALGANFVDVCMRSTSRAGGLTAVADRLGLEVSLHSWEQAAALLSTADLVISTLPPNGADELAAHFMGDLFDRQILLDVAYEPWPSALASGWEDRGGIIVPGLEMLIYQAVEQVRLFAGDAFTSESAVINVMCDAVGAPRR
ncbi:shikimate dehydrogenase [Arthrobacter sp. H5]|uniref:shikimate dehydrogenase n=1 Tax=Arthrobacter sp. H5 TaxID=1267973 RepID=UPI00048534F6|nr:shikimate dehydrogenase [Arthrobacter sp. H5]